jgi:hypothetical protein
MENDLKKIKMEDDLKKIKIKDDLKKKWKMNPKKMEDDL